MSSRNSSRKIRALYLVGTSFIVAACSASSSDPIISSHGTGGSISEMGGQVGASGGPHGGAGPGSYGGAMFGGAQSFGGSNSGGGSAKGGSVGSGGTTTTVGSGGATVGAGGTVVATSGGATAAAGATSSTCEAKFTVTNDGYVMMPAAGSACWRGYAFGGGDTTSMVTFSGGGTDFSKSMGKLELSGTVGSATEENKYAGNVYFGFNVNQAAGATATATVTPAGTSLTVTCTGCSTPPMRVQLQSAAGSFCAPLTSGTPIPYSSFKTECWGTTGTAYAKQPITSVQISIPGAATAATFDLTVTSVTEQ